jgi:hypothetical protein
MFRILIIVLGLSLPAAQDRFPQKTATPAEQYQTLLKEYQEASRVFWNPTTDAEKRSAIERVNKTSQILLELAQKNPEDPIALDALIQVVAQDVWMELREHELGGLAENDTPPRAQAKESPAGTAMRLLLRDHMESDRLGEVCRRAMYGFRKDYEIFLRAVLEKSPHRDIQGLACILLPQLLNNRQQKLDLIKGQPELAKSYERRFGKGYLDQLRRQDRAQVLAEAEALFDQASEKYGDVKIPYGGTVAERAETELFELRHLTAGKQAPDIAGEDQDGKRFRLNDYRGKVVLLYFWQQF